MSEPVASRPVLAVVGRPERGQVHARQPIPRPPRGGRPGLPGRHPRPRLTTPTGTGATSPRRHRRLVTHATGLAAQIPEQAETAITEADVVVFVVDAPGGHHRRRRRGRGGAAPQSRTPSCSWRTRSTTRGPRHQARDDVEPGARRAARGVRRCTAVAPGDLLDAILEALPKPTGSVEVTSGARVVSPSSANRTPASCPC